MQTLFVLFGTLPQGDSPIMAKILAVFLKLMKNLSRTSDIISITADDNFFYSKIRQPVGIFDVELSCTFYHPLKKFQAIEMLELFSHNPLFPENLRVFY